MPFQDDARTVPSRISGQPEVGMQHSTAPPFKHDHSGPLLVEISQRLGKRAAPVPVHPVVDRNVGRIGRGYHLGSNPVAAWVEASRDEAAHEQGADRVLVSKGTGKPVGVVADSGYEPPA